MTTFAPCTPVLRIFDRAQTLAFYVDFLEMKVDWEHSFEPDSPVYMQVSKGECAIQLSEHTGDALPGSCIRIRITELDAWCNYLAGKKYKYARPGPGQPTDWKTKETVIRDPSGNKLVFWEML